jgi:HEAT repeat protein
MQLNDPEWPVRYAAASALGQVGQERSEVVEALLTRLNDPERYVQASAAGVLGRLEIKDELTRQRLLVALNRRLHCLLALSFCQAQCSCRSNVLTVRSE